MEMQTEVSLEIQRKTGAFTQSPGFNLNPGSRPVQLAKRKASPQRFPSKHVDNYEIWIDPGNTDHYLVGCDGGVHPRRK
jgi:hypothetical protein